MDIARKKTSFSSSRAGAPLSDEIAESQRIREHISPDGFQPKGPFHLGEEQLWLPREKEVILPLRSAPIAVHFEEGKVPDKKSLFLKKRRAEYVRRGIKASLFIFVGIFLYGVAIFPSLERNVETGLGQVQQGVDSLSDKKFDEARSSFRVATSNFKKARQKTLFFPTWLAKPMTFVPGISRLGSGVLSIDASLHLTQAAVQATGVAEKAVQSQGNVESGKPVSYLELLSSLEQPLAEIRTTLQNAHDSFKYVPLRDIPEEKRMTFELLQSGVPGIVLAIDSLLHHTPLVEELLGKNGPRTYLFLFQNNQELRPTGGFIGTYGILEFKDGYARRFFIDGIFNPDGQLKENVVPPKAIQKISAGWSLHDSNWFPDFPTSAEKAIYFYEKTGGPTVDGVFTLTPTVMEELLLLTGPIELPEYGMTVDSKNFIPTIQEQVEVNYDKEENKPKKVLADLASILMERVFALSDPLALYNVVNIFVEGMNEKHILLYTRNDATQALIEEAGWSGRIQETPHDYLNVVHTNINGFKTDGVIEDSVEHTVNVQEDGSLLAQVKVKRKHTGGNTPYDWWNSVNSNYLRVYVPLGSKLISAEGHTKEFPPAPLDYTALNFTVDPDIQKEEGAITIHEESGTRVGEEFGKTVFGNWTYVSPGEEVIVEYTYLLPFRLNPDMKEERGYSLLFQKQPGVRQIELFSRVEYPESWDIFWQSEPGLLRNGESGIQLEQLLTGDAFWGVVFEK